MTAEANMNLIQGFWQASERGNIDEMAAFWAPDAINHGGQTAQAQRRPPQPAATASNAPASSSNAPVSCQAGHLAEKAVAHVLARDGLS